MLNQFSRTELLLGRDAMERLAQSRVAVFGIGGVGGYVCEALVRSGVGAIDLIDNDRVCLTNLNRQIIATRKTVGRLKAEVMQERILAINPKVNVQAHTCFFLPETQAPFPLRIMTMLWMPWTRFPPSCRWWKNASRRIRLSSAAWVQATNWIPPPFGSRIFTGPALTHWPV